MPTSTLIRSNKRTHARQPSDSGALCLETQGREVMARLVHDVVAEAMRLDLHGAPPPDGVTRANGAPFGRTRTKVQNG